LKKYLFFIASFIIVFLFISLQSPKIELRNVLIFTKTAGFRHESIKKGISAIKELGSQNGFAVFHTEDASFFNPSSLKKYQSIIFLNTTGDILNDEEQKNFEQYIQAGGGWVGIHSAADTEYKWPWYGQLVGAYFNGHPKIQNADLNVIEKSHPSTKKLPDLWNRKDEWYNYKFVNSNLNTTIKIDEGSYEGGTNGENHPISWYHNHDGGNAFYTGLGHTTESYQEKLFLDHILGGIFWSMGIEGSNQQIK